MNENRVPMKSSNILLVLVELPLVAPRENSPIYFSTASALKLLGTKKLFLNWLAAACQSVLKIHAMVI
jgi:hypothetical protein